MPKLRSEKDYKVEIIIKSDKDNEEQATQTEPLPEPLPDSITEYSFIEKNDVVYSGELKNDKYDGLGMIQYEDGNIYYGEWKNGWKTHGKMRYINGDVYSGEFKNENYHGKGTLTLSNGDVYSGELKNGICHGKGTFTWSNGDILDGIWENGVKVSGKLSYSDKRPTRIINRYRLYVIGYEGEMQFLNKKREVLFNGMGTVTLSNGNTFYGLFIEGMIDTTGKGKYIITKTNDIFEVSIGTALHNSWERQSVVY